MVMKSERSLVHSPERFRGQAWRWYIHLHQEKNQLRPQTLAVMKEREKRDCSCTHCYHFLTTHHNSAHYMWPSSLAPPKESHQDHQWLPFCWIQCNLAFRLPFLAAAFDFLTIPTCWKDPLQRFLCTLFSRFSSYEFGLSSSVCWQTYYPLLYH